MRSRRIQYGLGFAHGIVFHRFAPTGEDGLIQGALNPERLEALLQFVGIDRILSPDEWLARLARNALSQHDLCLTFDDGLKAQKEYALPVLERFGLKAFFFICSGVYHGHPIRSEVYSQAAARAGGMDSIITAFLERCPQQARSRLDSADFNEYCAEMRRFAPWYSRQDLEYRFLRNRVVDAAEYEAILDSIFRERRIDVDEISRTLWLDEADLNELAQSGHHIGLHSWDHPYELARLSPEAQREQYDRNRAHLASVTGRVPTVVAHPLNSYSAVTLAILLGLGVTSGFRANAIPPDGRAINAGPLEMAREDAANVLIGMDQSDELGG